MQSRYVLLVLASCLLPAAARGDPRPDGAAFATQAIGTTDRDSAVMVGTRWLVFDSTEARKHIAGGDFELDAQLGFGGGTAAGVSINVPFLIDRDTGDHTAGAFGNVGLWVQGNLVETPTQRFGLSLKAYLPTLWSLGNDKLTAVMMLLAAEPYDPGRFLPATIGLRPDLRYRLSFGGLRINAELGADFLFTISHHVNDDFQTNDATTIALHFGASVGYQFFGILTPYAEMQLSRIVRSGPDSSFGDFVTNVSVGPGIHVGAGPFIGDFYAMIMATKDYHNLFDALIGFRIGARF